MPSKSRSSSSTEQMRQAFTVFSDFRWLFSWFQTQWVNVQCQTMFSAEMQSLHRDGPLSPMNLRKFALSLSFLPTSVYLPSFEQMWAWNQPLPPNNEAQSSHPIFADLIWPIISFTAIILTFSTNVIYSCLTWSLFLGWGRLILEEADLQTAPIDATSTFEVSGCPCLSPKNGHVYTGHSGLLFFCPCVPILVAHPGSAEDLH